MQPAVTTKFRSRISFSAATTGVRTLMSILVMFHHIDLSNPRINRVSNLIWTIDRSQPHSAAQHAFHRAPDLPETVARALLSEQGRPEHGTLTTFGMMASVFDITLFCLISGYVLSLVAFKCYALDYSDARSTASYRYPFWLYKLVRLLIRRSLRMIFSLFVVQCATFALFHFECIGLRGADIFRANEFYYGFGFCRFSALFWAQINGALWICDVLFWAMFAALAVLCLAINLAHVKHRLCAYLFLCALFHDAHYLPVLAGIAAADIDHHGCYRRLFTRHKHVHRLLACSPLLLFVRIPLLGDFAILGRFLPLRTLAWFNLALFCTAGYPRCSLARLFAHDWLCCWGQFTFALYVWHVVVFRVIGTLLTPRIVDVDADAHIEALLWLDYAIVALALCAACAFAILFNLLCERPWNRRVVKPLLALFEALQNGNVYKENLT